jgi:membrane protein DedA with SNARE-associated domain
MQWKIFTRHQSRLDSASDLLRRRGGPAVFLGRFTAFFRAMMPALAGASEMHYPKFLVWNAAGGVVWGTTFVSLGYLFSDTYKKVEHTLGRWFAIGLAVIVVVAAVVWKIRSERTPEREGESPDA